MNSPKEKFKDRFVAAFCASWCATNYTDYCMRGMHAELEDPPIEDAFDLAESIWGKYGEAKANDILK